MSRICVRLIAALGERLPPELAVIRELLAADRSNALHALRVMLVEGVPAHTRWQRELVDKLNRDAGDVPPEVALEEVLEFVLAGAGESAPGALGVLQSRLYRPSDIQAPLDESVQWLGVRDFLQEAEVAAGMVQRLLAEDATLAPAQIGLLLPDDFEYSVAVEDAFRLGGLALSGLPAERWRRDLGREAVFHFLYCRHKPAPAMALAVVLSSPLMPWSREQGAQLAQAVMDGDYALKPPKNASAESRAMLALLREGDSEPATLAAALRLFASLITAPEELAGHLVQARAAVDELCAALTSARDIEWSALKRAVTPKLLTSGEAPDFNREGVTVWRESQEPWRPVRKLIVLGFAQDRYPAALSRNAVFSAEDLDQARQIHRTSHRDAGSGARASSRAVPAAAGLSRGGRDVSRTAPGCGGQSPVAVRKPGVHASSVHWPGDRGRTGHRARCGGGTGEGAAGRACGRGRAVYAARIGGCGSGVRARPECTSCGCGGEAEAGESQQSRDADGVAAHVVAATVECRAARLGARGSRSGAARYTSHTRCSRVCSRRV